jgi:radical SAM protein with 4Fe4S-binding SPASM domain
MIGCTKLLCGVGTVSDAIKYGKMHAREIPSDMLHFSTIARPLVVWNMTKRCNLRCSHCYIKAEDKEFKGELTTDEAKAFIDDLARMQVPVLLFSGGEPLIRKDFYELVEFASDREIRAVVSTNGTLIDRKAAEKMLSAGVQYVGVSIDGTPETHNEFRGVPKAFERALQGIKNAMQVGLKTGIRFTVSQFNYTDLDEVINVCVREKIPRFFMYHFVYAGRGKEIAKEDITIEQRRGMMEYLLKKTLELHSEGIDMEILTTDNHADGIFLYNYVVKNDQSRAREVMQLLEMHGGCSAGDKWSNVDSFGNVHACQFWGHLTLGNVKERKFSEIWNDENNEFLIKMREKPKHLKGRCSRCKHNKICGGCRIRAETVYGDLWQEDPACYLTDEEIMAR